MIIVKVTKKQGLPFSLEDTFFEKPQVGSNRTPSPFRVKNFAKFTGKYLFQSFFF